MNVKTLVLFSLGVLACAAKSSAASLSAELGLADNKGLVAESFYWTTNDAEAVTLKNSASLTHGEGTVQASYGYLTVTFNCDTYVNDLGAYGGNDNMQASWDDMVTISSPSLDGTLGYLRPNVRLSGTLCATASGAAGAISSISSSLSGFFGDGSTPGNFVFPLGLDATPANSPLLDDLSVNADALAASNGLPNLDIAFIYGQPFELKATLLGSTSVGVAGDNTMNEHGQLTFQWLGGLLLDASFGLVTNFTLTSQSGTDWLRTQGGNATPLRISNISRSAGTYLINGVGGTPYHQAFLLSSTNLALPLTNWDYVASGVVDISGDVMFTNQALMDGPALYFRLMVGNDFPASPQAVSHLTIIPTFDDSIRTNSNAPAIISAINAAIQVLQNHIADDLVVNVRFVATNTGLAYTEVKNWIFPYAEYLASLRRGVSSPDDLKALNSLPNSTNEPVLGGSVVRVALPLGRALGLNPPVSPTGFDAVSFYNLSTCNFSRPPADTNKYDLQRVVEHELDEVLGLGSRVAVGDMIKPMDLFRYTTNLVRTFTTAGDDAYFSVDGTNLLARFNMDPQADYHDWWSPNGADFWSPPGTTPTPQVQDAFAGPGVPVDLGPNELTALDVIGYTLTSYNLAPVKLARTNPSASRPAPQPGRSDISAPSTATFSKRNNGSAPIDAYVLRKSGP